MSLFAFTYEGSSSAPGSGAHARRKKKAPKPRCAREDCRKRVNKKLFVWEIPYFFFLLSL